MKTNKFAFNSSHGPLALSTATTLPSSRRSFCGGSSRRPDMAAQHMMTMKEMYTALGTPSVVALFLFIINGIIPPMTEPKAWRLSCVVT